MHSHAVSLDPDLRCADAIEFENDLRERFIGQEEATVATVRMLQTFMAGMNNPDQPADILLALGPTGTGKTRSLRPASPKNLARARGGTAAQPLLRHCSGRRSAVAQPLVVRCAGHSSQASTQACSVSGSPTQHAGSPSSGSCGGFEG
jgi:hypothetical protein